MLLRSSRAALLSLRTAPPTLLVLQRGRFATQLRHSPFAGSPAPSHANRDAACYDRRAFGSSSRRFVQKPADGKESLLPRAILDQLLESRKALHQLEQQLHDLRLRFAATKPPSRSIILLLSLISTALALYATYNLSSDVRRVTIAAERCGRIGTAVVLCIIDYKMLFYNTDALPGTASRHDAYEACHLRCAERIRDVLKKNGGIYIKLGNYSPSAISVIWADTTKQANISLRSLLFPPPGPRR